MANLYTGVTIGRKLVAEKKAVAIPVRNVSGSETLVNGCGMQTPPIRERAPSTELAVNPAPRIGPKYASDESSHLRFIFVIPCQSFARTRQRRPTFAPLSTPLG
jgi:hypothetical protein